MTEIRVSVPAEVDSYLDSIVRTGMFGNKAEILRSALAQFTNAVGPISKGYDTGTLFSPEGRIYQLEFAREASYRGATVAGVVCSDGVLLGAECRMSPPGKEMLVVNPEKFFTVSRAASFGASGLVMDAWAVLEELRRRKMAGSEELLSAVRAFYWQHTVSKGVRPLGVNLLLGCCYDRPRLFEVDASGAMLEVNAWAIGERREEACELFGGEYRPMKMKEAEKLVLEALGKPKQYALKEIRRSQ